MTEFTQSYGCHQGVPFKPAEKPETWRPLFRDCPCCGGSKLLALIETRAHYDIAIWVCVPCNERRQSYWRNKEER